MESDQACGFSDIHLIEMHCCLLVSKCNCSNSNCNLVISFVLDRGVMHWLTMAVVYSMGLHDCVFRLKSQKQ